MPTHLASFVARSGARAKSRIRGNEARGARVNLFMITVGKRIRFESLRQMTGGDYNSNDNNIIIIVIIDSELVPLRRVIRLSSSNDEK